MALERNQSVRAARLDVDQARANETTAGLKPNPLFTSLNADFPVFTPSQLTWPNIGNNQSFTQSLSYLFERGAKRQKRVEVARDTTDVTARTVEDSERTLRFQVMQAFVDVLLAKSNFEFATEDLSDFDEVVEVNRHRMEKGDISDGDFLKIALQKLQFEQDVSSARLALVQARANLRQLLGYQSVAEDFDVAGRLEHRPYTATLEQVRQEALASRPDLQAAASGTRLADSTSALAYANRARDLVGEVEYDRNGPVNGIGFGFSIDLPIHDRNQGEIARSIVAARQARESESAARVQVLTDVESAFATLETNDRLVSVFESGYLAQAGKSREISRYAYSRGASSLLDLLDAERTYRATQISYRQTLAAYMTSVAQVNFAAGKQVIP
jgi:cobalt-zinc-cadmium efflux system outer membrane protein